MTFYMRCNDIISIYMENTGIFFERVSFRQLAFSILLQSPMRSTLFLIR